MQLTAPAPALTSGEGQGAPPSASDGGEGATFGERQLRGAAFGERQQRGAAFGERMGMLIGHHRARGRFMLIE